jgi:hypothetical protein
MWTDSMSRCSPVCQTKKVFPTYVSFFYSSNFVQLHTTVSIASKMMILWYPKTNLPWQRIMPLCNVKTAYLPTYWSWRKVLFPPSWGTSTSITVCSRTAKVVIKHLHEKVIEIRLINSTSEPRTFCIPHITFGFQHVSCPRTIQCRQFPLRLAYATTCNSCQGLTLNRVVLDPIWLGNRNVV